MRIGEVLTMAEYINRDDLLKAAWGNPTLSLSVYDIGNIKPVDVAPVRHGRWKTNSDRPDSLICSICKCGFDMWKHDPHNFCPNCGAIMDLEVS